MKVETVSLRSTVPLGGMYSYFAKVIFYAFLTSLFLNLTVCNLNLSWFIFK